MKRKKDPPRGRRDRALLTRRRMLRAAYDLFCKRGYAGTTMELIAAQAGVAVQTLYFTFHTKSAILEETLGAAILGFDDWDPRVQAAMENQDPPNAFATFHPWFDVFERARTARRALQVFLDAAMDIFERAAPLALVQSAAAASDPQVKASWELAERRRVEVYTLVVESLAKRGKLRRGANVRRTRDVMLTLLSAESFVQLTERSGWSLRAYRKWLLEVLEWQMFG